MVNPAYSIPLNENDLALLGELVVILGQIEEEMMLTVSGLIQGDRPTTEKVMGSSKAADKSAIWAALIKLRAKDNAPLHAWVDFAIQQLADLSADRNDFIHSNWQHRVSVHLGSGNDGEVMVLGNERGEPIELHMRFTLPSPRPEKSTGIAKRIQNFARSRPSEDIRAARDKAATLSCVFAHIGHCVEFKCDPNETHSAWRDRLPPLPQPRPAKAKARKGKAREAPRAPSKR
jgi:hypothetical protein